jgi:hypothetical protein
VLLWVFGHWILKVDNLHGGRQYALGLSSALAVFVVLQIMIVRYGLGYSVDVSRTTAFVAAFFFIVIGNLLPKVQPSAPRFQWPKSLDAPKQRRVQRLTGIPMMASGFCLLIANAFDVPPVWPNSGSILAALVPAAAGITYALLLSPESADNR